MIARIAIGLPQLVFNIMYEWFTYGEYDDAYFKVGL